MIFADDAEKVTVSLVHHALAMIDQWALAPNRNRKTPLDDKRRDADFDCLKGKGNRDNIELGYELNLNLF